MFATRQEAFAHLKSIVTEIDAERRGERRRPTDEVRRRRVEIAVMLLFAEMVAKVKPELANRAEMLATAETILSRDFVAELEAMAKPDRAESSHVDPQT